MTTKERAELDRLSRKWAAQLATMKEMDRCMELKRKAEYEAQQAAEPERSEP